MTKLITYAEKAIGGFHMIWGTFSIFLSIYGMNNLYDFGGEHFQLTGEKISILKLLKTYQFELLLSTLLCVSGILLILNKKSGWQLAIITSFVTALPDIQNLILFDYGKSNQVFNNETIIVLQMIIVALFLLIAFTISSGPFRKKYNPTKGNWWAIIIITAFLLCDKIIDDIMK